MAELPSATITEFRQWEPCWHSERVEAYLGLHPEMRWTALDVLALTSAPEPHNVTHSDALWVVLRPELVPAPVLRAFAYWCADRARLLAGIPCEPVTDRDTAAAAVVAARAARGGGSTLAQRNLARVAETAARSAGAGDVALAATTAAEASAHGAMDGKGGGRAERKAQVGWLVLALLSRA